jgi:hypothetical protein
MRPITREIIERRQPTIRWSAVFAGTAISIALWLLLQMLGMGIGLTAVDDADSLRGVALGTTAWALIAPVIAMFLGGLATGRVSGTADRGVAAEHGVVVWALTALLGAVAMTALLRMIAGVADTSDLASSTSEVRDTGKILLGAGISLLVSLVSAALGAAAAVIRRDRRRRDTVTIETPVVPPPVEPMPMA